MKLCFVAFAIWFSFLNAIRAADEIATKPNVVLIFIDDLGYADIGPFGSKVNRTPNLDRMASEGSALRLSMQHPCAQCHERK